MEFEGTSWIGVVPFRMRGGLQEATRAPTDLVEFIAVPRKIICTVPERACTRDRIQAVEEALSAIYGKHFGMGTPLAVLWCPLPEGQSYVAGARDDVYLFMVEVAEGLDQPKRKSAMMEITKQVSGSFGIGLEKPLVSALDSSKVDEYLKSNRNRLKWQNRPGFLLGTLWHAFRSRKRDGFATIRANL